MPPARKAQAKAAPKKPAPDRSKVVEAITSEEALGEQADAIWKGNEYLDAALLRELRPLLYAPIPEAFIEEIGVVKGKPYTSTGVRSVQVQIDRLNRVLGMSNWRDNYSYTDEGRICHVIISILGAPVVNPNTGASEREVLVQRSSFGGVDHGSTRGNIHKGSYTNAAKVAIARLGPGHEIYVGVPDLDPDVSQELASGGPAAEEKPKATKVAKEQVEQLRNLWRQSGVDDKAWKTFLASRKKKDVTDFDNDDFQAAVSFLAEHGEDD